MDSSEAERGAIQREMAYTAVDQSCMGPHQHDGELRFCRRQHGHKPPHASDHPYMEWTGDSWPDHPWHGEYERFGCNGCHPKSPWRDDPEAHALGEYAHSLNLLRAIQKGEVDEEDSATSG